MESNLTLHEKPFRVGVFATLEKADAAVNRRITTSRFYRPRDQRRLL